MPRTFNRLLTRRVVITTAGLTSGALLLRPMSLLSANANSTDSIESQPYFAGVNRALEALTAAGQPIPAADAGRLTELAEKGDVASAEAILDRYTLVRVAMTADGYHQTQAGGAEKKLIEQGWSAFLVRISNPIASTASLDVTGSDESVTGPSSGAPHAGIWDTVNPAPGIASTWYRNVLYRMPPLGPTLSGARLEYG